MNHDNFVAVALLCFPSCSAVVLLWLCCGSVVLLLWSVVLLQWLCCGSAVLLVWLSYISAQALQITVSLTRPWSASRIWTIDSLKPLLNEFIERRQMWHLWFIRLFSQITAHQTFCTGLQRNPMPWEHSQCEFTDLAWLQQQFCHFASSRTPASYHSCSNWEVWSSHQMALSYHEI